MSEPLPAVLTHHWLVKMRGGEKVLAALAELLPGAPIYTRVHVAERIQRAYRRDSDVIYPPVDLPTAPATTAREDFYLCVGHHTAYKRLDLAMDACRMLNRRLVIIGDGPEVKRLRDDQSRKCE